MKTLPVLLTCGALVLLPSCSTVESRIAQNRSSFDSWPAPVQQSVSAGQVGVGFTMEQVEVALGKPDYVFSRSAAEGSFQVWSYRDKAPRFSFGVGMGSFGGRSGVSSGLGVSTGQAYPDEKLRVIFDQSGRVVSLEEVMRGR